MGLLTVGTPLSWEETKQHAQLVRERGIEQFLRLYHTLKFKTKDYLRWGDEVEYTVVKFDHVHRKVYLKLCATKLLPLLQAEENEALVNSKPVNLRSLWRPEFAEYMLEGLPGKPYGHLIGHFNTVEANMKIRREEVMQYLEKDEFILTITAFPRLGCVNFTYPQTEIDPKHGITRSLFYPDNVVCQIHPRFSTIARNIRQRRNEKVVINIPVYKDINTQDCPLMAENNDELMQKYCSESEEDRFTRVGLTRILPHHVYMDAMGFGMGCCCLQMTFQAASLMEARVLYDQLAPLSPILMCLSAATPAIRGLLTDNDCRWDVVSASVDDRTLEELGQQPLQNDRYVIPKSRYGTISSYLSPHSEDFNDIPLVMDQGFYQKLISEGVDHLIAQHIAHLFIRDPVLLFQEKVLSDDVNDSDHFENIQSTNWQSMRFKPPPPNSDIGWRVEFRPTETQITDFENAAFVTFVVLLSRVIATLRLNFLIPISKVDENFATAMKRNAVLDGMFYFRRAECIITSLSPPEATEVCDTRKRSCSETERPHYQPQNCYIKMSVNTIVNGNNEFPGLIPLIKQYLRMVEVDVDTLCTINQYLSLISKRASGELKTTANWIRSFITSHSGYGRDSRVTEEINYDLLCEIVRITKGESRPTDLLPAFQSRSKEHLPSAVVAGETLLDTRRTLLRSYRTTINEENEDQETSDKKNQFLSAKSLSLV